MFFHLDKEHCFSFESLAHARTKKYLYELFSKAGYIVKEEKRHKDISRADVAVLQTIDGKEELKLAIEVQASNIRTSNIAKRTNIYFEENVPTAWMLILDSFFPPKEKEVNGEKIYTDSYSGTRISSFNPETNFYEYTYISLLKEEYFFVTGENNKAFNYLMDVYHVIVTVDHNGHVFLIRRTPESSKLRVNALLENRDHSTQNDIFLVNRIAESDIVPVLLETELLRAPNSEKDTRLKKSTQLNEEFKGQIHRSDSVPTKLVDAAIEFDKARQIEEALNSIELARKAREDMKIAYTNKLLEIERLETEKVQFELSSIGNWYFWLNYLTEEHYEWHIVVKTLFKGFPTTFLRNKNDFEIYFNKEQNRYKNWIESRNLIELVEELERHYEQVTNNTSEKMFYKGLWDKYGQKLDKVQKKKK
ncbi:competence protein CoiA family protein [Bacillus cereus group sp. BfR-BA-01346]|uniref:competence protein CoiA family protein n=1 Tax=Bacillus cereus group sp. BfR-BA-01346 TaxID=2920309 RepID=UPI0037BF9A49